jgi:uncharacterized membrane protein YcaP (DUF421 family)
MKQEFKDHKTVIARVQYLLTVNPLLRDNDMRLIATYYFEEIGKEKIAEMSAMDFLTMISTSKVTCFETIRKLRQQAQAKNEKLRGEEYGKRKKKVLSNFLIFKRD